MPELSPFTNKVIEALTLKLHYPDNKSVLITSIYRSNGEVANLTQNQKLTNFMHEMDNLLTLIARTNFDSYICLDVNLDILNLTIDEPPAEYLDLIFSHGFLQTVSKATRMQGTSATHLDHILTNSNANPILTGMIICDISDHFMTFICPDLTKTKPKTKTKIVRQITLDKLETFRRNLGNINWNHVTNCVDADGSYEAFWSTFKPLYDIHFPEVKVRFNKNHHKINDFMTQGLLISRHKKLELQKKSLTNPTPANLATYKNYRNIFNKTIRARKKLFNKDNLEANANDPKKTWQTLNEIVSGEKKHAKIDKIKS
jgi:hypothetical protein